MSRAAAALSDIPLANLSVMALCCLVYLFQVAFDPPLHHYTMCPRNIIHLNEYYRFVTSSLFHGGFMHLAFNMMSTAAIGSLLEKRFGTLRHAITILWGILLTSAVYTLCALTLHVVLDIEKLMYQHSVGFSGVIFQLSVLEANLSPNTTRDVFGFFRVPAYLYPWALLVALQFIMPQVSFVGHLSGILVGTLQLYGALDIIAPSDQYLREMEEWLALGSIRSRRNFVKTPANDASIIRSRNPGELRGAIIRCLGMVWKFLKDVVQCLKVIIFGYGVRENENIQLLGDAAASLGSGAGAAVGDGGIDDDDWVGLPPPPSPNEVEATNV